MIARVKREKIRRNFFERGARVVRFCDTYDRNTPAIKEKWPNQRQTICIQQDNCRAILEAVNVNGWTMEFYCQPSQNPDLNVLDIGFLNLVQSIHHKHAACNLS